MIWLTNQIVCISAWISSFQPTLVPAPTELSETEVVEQNFRAFDDSDFNSDNDGDSEMCADYSNYTKFFHILTV